MLGRRPDHIPPNVGRKSSGRNGIGARDHDGEHLTQAIAMLRVAWRLEPNGYDRQIFFHDRRVRTSHFPRSPRQAAPCNHDSLPFFT